MSTFLQLTIPHSKFIEEYEKFKKELSELLLLQPRDVTSYKGEFDELGKKITVFLQESFNNPDNKFFREFRGSKAKGFNLGAYTYTEDTVRENIKVKINEINFQLIEVEFSDLIVNYSEDLYQKRQTFTIDQKEDFILMKLYDLNKRGIKEFWCINSIYFGNGLKEDIDYEPIEITKSLSDKKLVEQYAGSTGTLAYAKLGIGGLKYAQNLNAKAFGIYSVSEELSITKQLLYKSRFERIKEEIVTEMKEEFKSQKEFLTVGLDTLYQLIDESLVLIDSKLPEKNVKEGIVGKMLSKAKNKGMDLIIKMVWEKMKQDPIIVSWFEDTIETLKLN